MYAIVSIYLHLAIFATTAKGFLCESEATATKGFLCESDNYAKAKLILRLICLLSKSGEISKLDIGRVRLE